jgi:hypothetical protein
MIVAMADVNATERILPARTGDYPAVQNWIEQFTMDGLIIRWSPAPLLKAGLIAEALIGILWAGAFVIIDSALPSAMHAVFAALAAVPAAAVVRCYARESQNPVWLDLDVHRRRLDLPRFGKHVSLDDSRVRFIHDYFRESGAVFNKSEFNIEVTPVAGGPPEFMRLLAFRGYREDFDRLGDRLRQLGFAFLVRKHEL